MIHNSPRFHLISHWMQGVKLTDSQGVVVLRPPSQHSHYRSSHPSPQRSATCIYIQIQPLIFPFVSPHLNTRIFLRGLFYLELSRLIIGR